MGIQGLSSDCCNPQLGQQVTRWVAVPEASVSRLSSAVSAPAQPTCAQTLCQKVDSEKGRFLDQSHWILAHSPHACTGVSPTCNELRAFLPITWCLEWPGLGVCLHMAFGVSFCSWSCFLSSIAFFLLPFLIFVVFIWGAVLKMEPRASHLQGLFIIFVLFSIGASPASLGTLEVAICDALPGAGVGLGHMD